MGIFDSIGDLFTNNAQTQAANAQTAGINAGLGSLNNYFGQGQQALQSNYTAGLQPFLQNYQQSQPGTQMYGNAVGLGGATGSQQALQAFQQSNPGYQFQLQQGQNAVLANQAKTGQLNSGNTNLDLQAMGTNLANQSYNNWVSQLNPYLNQANTAATGIGTMDSNLGNQLNANYMGQGNANYGAQASIGNANANAALGNLTAGSNIVGLGMGLAGLGTGGGTTLGGNLFSKFLS